MLAFGEHGTTSMEVGRIYELLPVVLTVSVAATLRQPCLV